MGGGDGRGERFESERQRTIVLTFDTPEQAADWDRLDDAQALAAVVDLRRVGSVR